MKRPLLSAIFITTQLLSTPIFSEEIASDESVIAKAQPIAPTIDAISDDDSDLSWNIETAEPDLEESNFQAELSAASSHLLDAQEKNRQMEVTEKVEVSLELTKNNPPQLPEVAHSSLSSQELLNQKQELALSPEKLAEPTKEISNTTASDSSNSTSLKKEAFAAVIAPSEQAVIVDFKQVFSGAPFIYSLLLIMSIFSLFIGLYTLLSMRTVIRTPDTAVTFLKNKLASNQYEEAFSYCLQQNSLLCKMLASAIHSRKQGAQVATDAMKTEGKRISASFWQKLSLLNDIAMIAPMVGLLGTVMGMFYAFYDLNRSIESISMLLDGLGISVGTTVGGLLVSILSLTLYSIVKYRLVRLLNTVENEAHSFVPLIESSPLQ